MSRMKDVVRSVSEDLYGRGRVDLVDRYFAEGFVNHDPPMGFGADRDGVRAFVQAIHAGLSDVEAETTHLVVEGNLAAVRWTVSAVHTGDLFGIPATQRAITVNGIGIYRFEGERIVEEWHRQDDLGMLQQLGALPEAA